ncbi:MAG: ThiF family adenylyltransferase [Candidatus Freyarchaeota archaeon]|nr:ThiF family adenylyltransferase [Candidatus Freyrarchaeum guaymaensis]HDO81498.1 adenylyltransferase [Candidatus Bathyarchaeota archaeon]
MREDRYHRQRLLKEWSQEKVRGSTVFIAGVGALGSVVALNLVMMGVGEILIADYDTVEVSNLNRQLLFKEDDVGRNKAEAARDALLEVNPDVKVEAFPVDIAEVPREHYEKCDVIVDGLDTFEARRWINSLAVELKKPLVHGGMYGWWGNVQVVIPYVTPCLECQPLIPEDRLMQICTPLGVKRKKRERVKVREALPAVVTVSCVIGGIQSQEVVKILLGLKPLDSFLFYDGLNQAFTLVPLRRNPKCVVCGEEYALKGVEYALDPEETVGELKGRLSATWGLREPVRLVYKARLIEGDDKKIKELNVKSGDVLFVYDQSRAKPVKITVKIS